MGNLRSHIPSRILYTMLRVSELERSVSFYKQCLGMKELARDIFTEGRFTLVFMGYGDGFAQAAIELTYNWDNNSYQHGDGYGHIVVEVADIYAACEQIRVLGYPVLREPGPMIFGADDSGKKEVIAFIQDPDGFKIELIQAEE